VSAYPLTLEGTSISALVVGAGRVATRKALALLEAGARVHVVALGGTTELEHAAEDDDRLTVTRAAYSPAQIGDATLVIAATNDPAVNAAIAHDAVDKGRLVNVVDAPAAGNCTTPAVLRSGNLVVSVTAGGVPAAAKRIRDELAAKLDGRYASAVAHLAALRRAMIDDGQRDRWTEASAALVGGDFCEQVESGTFDERVARWR
jgi:precorrin-2 dehydrogenase / sirohydrochlorin ferrochelatase